jgi:hypothetical protein
VDDLEYDGDEVKISHGFDMVGKPLSDESSFEVVSLSYLAGGKFCKSRKNQFRFAHMIA